MLLWLLRGVFVALIICMATFALVYLGNPEHKYDTRMGIIAFVAILAVGVGIVVGDIFIRNKQITTISAVYFGLLLGLLLGALFATALEPIVSDTWLAEKKDRLQTLTLFITVVCCYVSISLLLQTKDEFRFIIPYVEFSK